MKNILISIFTLGITLSSTIGNGNQSGENGKISGIVTFNEVFESSCKADGGAEIYAIRETDLGSTQYADIASVIESLQSNKSDYWWLQYNVIDPVKIKKIQDNFDDLSGTAGRYIQGFKQLPAIIRTSANGNGSYSLNVRPGRYCLLIVSANIKSNNLAEAKGKIDYRIVDIKPVSGSILNVNFEKLDKMMPILLTRSLLKGC